MTSPASTHISSQLSMIPAPDAAVIPLHQPKNAERRRRTSKSIDDALVGIRARTEAAVARKVIDFDNRVLQASFPHWDDELRGVPNPFIRSGLFGVNNTKSRPFIEGMKVVSLSNYEIKYTGRELQQDDLSVWMSLINMARANPLQDKVRFSGYQIVKDIGWRLHGDSYTRVKESIERLQVTGITIETKNQSEGYTGSLIREFQWEDADEQGKTKWMVRFEPKVALLFASDTTTLLEWGMRKKIGNRSKLAQYLHAFYASHREPIPLGLKKLHELSRSQSPLSTFRRNIKMALQTLVEVGLLKDFDTSNDVVRVTKRSQVQSIGVSNKPVPKLSHG